MNNIFYNNKFPFHYSIGAIVLNENNQVMCHHFKQIFEFVDLFICMRETPEENETIAETLERGLREEFGATAEIDHYIGSIVSHHDGDDIKNIEKTTLYFLCHLKDCNPDIRDKDDPESGSEIVFLEINKLIEKCKNQGKRYSYRTDFDESKILEQIKNISMEK
jgi:hypothetical protein